MLREVSVPVTTLLAFVAGSSANLDDLIAQLVGREVTQEEVASYLGNHLPDGDERENAANIIAGWERVYCNIPPTPPQEYRVQEYRVAVDILGGEESRVVRVLARSTWEALCKGQSYFHEQGLGYPAVRLADAA